MIDISTYHQKLEILKEYMSLVIDGKNPVIFHAVEKVISVHDLLNLYCQTGCLPFRLLPVYETSVTPIPFDEYYQSKQEIK